MSDGIIGSVGVAVVPDAEGFWREFKRRTDPGSESAGRDLGRGVRRGMDEELARPVTVRVNTNTNDVKQATQQMHLLRDAIIFLGPATIPVAGVLSGALLGAVPVAATLALGIKGISDEMKSGQLVGTQYGKDLAALSSEGKQLKTIASAGLLSGIDRAVQTSGPLFKDLNSDVGIMSTQLGNIVAGAGPALVSIFTALNPLFTTFGNLLSSGAAKLEHWSTSSNGIQSFVAYVQTELPQVQHLLGGVVTLVSHLLQGAAGAGGALLHDLNLVVDAIDAIPVSVLQTAIPLVLALYGAFRTYGAVTAIVAGVNRAISSMQAPMVATAGTAVAEAAVLVRSSQAVALAAADEAEAVAKAKATEADALAAATEAMVAPSEGMTSLFENEAVIATGAARDITASWQGVASLFATDTDLIIESATEQAGAYRAAALAATLSAEEIAAASVGASDTVAASGKKAALGWTGMLGPLAAVGVGVLLLTSIFGSNADAAQHNQEIMNGYGESLKQNADALASVNIQQTAKNLKDDGAIDLAAKLTKGNSGLAVGYANLTLAVNGTQAQFDTLYGSLLKVAAANKLGSTYHDTGAARYNETGAAAVALAGKIKQLRDDMTGEMKVQAELADIQKQSQIAIDGGTSAVAENARQLGLTSDAYLAAQQSTQKNIDATKAQTAAFQLDNDAGSLLAQTLDKLSGKKLGYQQSLNQFQSQLQSGVPQVGGTVDTSTAQGKLTAATLAATNAQTRYNAAVKGGDSAKIASAHLALVRAENAVASATNGLTSAQVKNAKAAAANSTSIKGLSTAAVANRGNLISQVSSAEQAAEAYGKMTGSSAAARQNLINLRKDIIENAVAHGEDRKQVTAFVDSLLTIPKTIPPTKLDVEKTAAQKKVDDLQARINRIKQGKEPHLDANSVEARGVVAALQAEIDALHGKTVVLSTIVTAQTGANLASTYRSQVPIFHKAAGGPIVGPGPKGVDSVFGVAAPGEFVMSSKAVDRFGLGVMQAMNAGVTPKSLAGAEPSGGSVTVYQTINNPVPEPASASGPAGVRRAALALGR